MRVPWTATRSNQSILKEISPEYSLKGLMLKLQYFGHLTGRTDSLEKTLMLGKIEGRRRRGGQRMRWLDGHHQLDGHEFEQAPRVGDRQGGLVCCSHGVTKSRTRLSHRTELNPTSQGRCTVSTGQQMKRLENSRHAVRVCCAFSLSSRYCRGSPTAVCTRITWKTHLATFSSPTFQFMRQGCALLVSFPIT